MVTFNEVSAPDPRLSAAKDAESLEGCTGRTPSALDGISAPQGRGAAHTGTSTHPALAKGAGSSASPVTHTGDIETPGTATEDSVTCLIGLLRETSQGSHEAFAELYRRTSPRVYGVVRRVVIDRGLSEEVTQEVFIVVWRDAATYDPGLGSPTGWMSTIAHRKAVDKVRSYQSSANRDGRWASASWARPYDEVGTSVLERMDAHQLRNSLAALSPLQREAILLAYYGSLTYREVAERLSTPLPTIKSRIRDGLKQLRGQLEPA